MFTEWLLSNVNTVHNLLDEPEDILRIGTEHMTIQLALTASVFQNCEVLFSPCDD